MEMSDSKKAKIFSVQEILKQVLGQMESIEIIDYLKKNHFPVLWLYDKNQDEKSFKGIESILRQAYQSQWSEYQQSRSYFQEFNQKLRDQGIDYILIKSAGIAPSFPWESDNIDILFLEKEIPEVKNILLKLKYFELKHIREEYKTLFRRFDSGKPVSVIHVHSNVGWEGVPFVDLPGLWKNKRRADDDSQLTIPGAEDAFLITVAHALYENKKIQLADFIKLAFLFQGNNLDINYIFSMAQRRGWKNGLVMFLQVVNGYVNHLFGRDLLTVEKKLPQAMPSNSGLTNLPFRFNFFENAKLWYEKIRCDELISKSEKIKQVNYSTIVTLKRKITRYKRVQPAFYVGIAGIDGSGKTLQTEMLDRALSISEIYTRIVWIRGAVVKTVEVINNLFSKKGSPPQKDKDIGGKKDLAVRKKILNNIILSFFYKSVILAETALKFNFKIRWNIFRRKVVISDRTIYDAVIDFGIRFDDDKIFDRMFSKLLILLTPKPQLSFLLIASKDLILQRKVDEVDGHVLDEKLRLYQQLAKNKKFQPIDTSLSVDTVHQQMLASFFKRYYEKYQKPYYSIVNPT